MANGCHYSVNGVLKNKKGDFDYAQPPFNYQFFIEINSTRLSFFPHFLPFSVHQSFPECLHS